MDRHPDSPPLGASTLPWASEGGGVAYPVQEAFMGFFPCDADHRRFTGPTNHAYAAVVRGRESDRRTFRLCAVHTALLRQQLNRRLTYVDFDTDVQLELEGICGACG